MQVNDIIKALSLKIAGVPIELSNDNSDNDLIDMASMVANHLQALKAHKQQLQG